MLSKLKAFLNLQISQECSNTLQATLTLTLTLSFIAHLRLLAE